jgi:hypothetical protein
MDITPQPITKNPESWFYTATRPKNDTVKQNQEAEQNSGALNWNLTHPVPDEQTRGCTMERTTAFASQFPTMNYTGNYGNTAVGGCDIDLYSRLMLGDVNTQRVKGHQQVFARPWATTPNMGGGPGVTQKDTESRLIQAVPVRQRKEFGTVTDKTFPNYWTPMIPELRSEMSDVNTYVEQWTRGGDPSRLNVKNRVLQ